MIFLFKLTLRQASMDFRRRYLGTLLGGVWALISPLVTIALIYFVFTYGLKVDRMGGVSFINWLVPGMLVWFFISESLLNGCTVLIENSHLVTKVVFPLHILPPTKIISSLPVHLILVAVMLPLLIKEGTGTPGTWWQLIYYLFCAGLLCTAINYITSACMVFIKDTQHILGVIVQILFWTTPIFWNPNILKGSRAEIILYSPFNYVVQGYRDALFNSVNFWDKPEKTIVFWVVTMALLGFGHFFFSQTRPHFADVL